MWWDSSATIDLNFLELMPFFYFQEVQDFPIQPKKMVQLANLSNSQVNISASIGLLVLLHQKNQVTHLAKEYEINHLDFLDRLLFLMSDCKMKKEMENSLRWYGRMIFQKWFATVDQPKLEKMLISLKESINLLEKTWFMEEYKKQSLNYSQSISQKTRKYHPQLQKAFQQHVKYIFLNKKQMTFLYFLYQIKYLLIKHISKLQFYDYPEQMIKEIKGQLFQLSTTYRLSFSIETMALVLRKLLDIRLRIPIGQLKQFQGLVTSVIAQYQIIQVNLTEKASFFAYHMKSNFYFDYLQEMFAGDGLYCRQKLRRWKNEIRSAIAASVQKENKKEMKKQDIFEIIFYLQLRQSQRYLFGQDTSINDFPDLNSKVLRQTIKTSTLVSLDKSQDICAVVINELIDANQEYIAQLFKGFNIIEKSIFVYYIIYFKSVKSASEHVDIKTISREQINLSIELFFNYVSNQDLLDLIDFYFFQIRLGNYYNVTVAKTEKLYNSVNHMLYNQMLSLLFQRIKNSLTFYKQLKTTLDLKILVNFTKYFAILMCTLAKQNQTSFVCPHCKLVFSLYACPYCQNILLGIKLRAQTNLEILYKIDPFFYTSMVNQLRKLVRQATQEIDKICEEKQGEWLNLLLLVLNNLKSTINDI